MGVGVQCHALAALQTGKTRYPWYRMLGMHQDRSGRARKISLPPGFDPRTVQSVASRYTDWAIECTYTNLDSIAYYSPSLHIAYYS